MKPYHRMTKEEKLDFLNKELKRANEEKEFIEAEIKMLSEKLVFEKFSE